MTVQMICGAQIAEAYDCVDSEALTKNAKATEEYISRESEKMGLAMVKFIHGQSREIAPRRGRKPQWSDWVI